MEAAIRASPTMPIALRTSEETRAIPRERMSNHRRLNAAVVLAMMALGSTACAENTRAQADPVVDPNARGEEVSFDYESPLGALGREVTDVAASSLPFVPLLPASLDATVRNYVYAPSDESAATAAFVFENDAWGQVLLLEYSDSMTPEGLLAEADNKGGGCSPVPLFGNDALSCSWDPFDVVDLGGGTRALFAAGEDLTTLMWVTDLDPVPGNSSADFEPNSSVTVQVIGNTTMLSRAEIVAFGRLVIGS